MLLLVLVIIMLSLVFFSIYSAREKSESAQAEKPADPKLAGALKKMLSSKNVKLFGDTLVLSIVGESKYQNEIREIAKAKDLRAGDLTVDATIKAEPDNPYDKNAIVVKISDATVGYIAKSDTAWFHEFLARSPGEFSSKAEIRGGGKVMYGVFLQVPLR